MLFSFSNVWKCKQFIWLQEKQIFPYLLSYLLYLLNLCKFCVNYISLETSKMVNTINYRSIRFVMSLSAHLICSKIPGLSPEQRRICQQKPEALAVIKSGIKLGIDECQRQFRNRRWNCTLMNGQNLFTHTMLIGMCFINIFKF